MPGVKRAILSTKLLQEGGLEPHTAVFFPLPYLHVPNRVSSMFKSQTSLISRPSIFTVPRDLKVLHSFCASNTHTTSQPCFPGPRLLSLGKFLSPPWMLSAVPGGELKSVIRQAQSLTQTVGSLCRMDSRYHYRHVWGLQNTWL